jgi:hypothetical protein
MRPNVDAYNRYIASHAWACKRDERKQIDGHCCQTCDHDGSLWRLEVHHKTYERFMDEDVARDLITLCAACHEAVTNVIRSRRYDGKPVPVGCVSDVSLSRKDVSYGMEDADVSDHRRRAADHAQWSSRKPAVRCV